MKLITVKLNNNEIAFDFKVCNNLKDFYRCDVSVLYIYKTSFTHVIDLLSFDYKDMIMKRYIKNKTPSMTYKLFEGVGVADSPEDGDSFGLNRCRIISDGIISSLDETNTSKKIKAIKLAFENSNLNVEKPYLNSDSNDVYEKYVK